jgi:hypothetical protein
MKAMEMDGCRWMECMSIQKDLYVDSLSFFRGYDRSGPQNEHFGDYYGLCNSCTSGGMARETEYCSTSNKDHPSMAPTLPDNGDSPGGMHRFQVSDGAPALPAGEPVKAHKPKCSQSSVVMSSDLQAIMERRRQMVETTSTENAPTAALLNTTTNSGLGLGRTKAPYHRLKTVGMSADLQAIMVRRRRLADDGND